MPRTPTKAALLRRAEALEERLAQFEAPTTVTIKLAFRLPPVAPVDGQGAELPDDGAPTRELPVVNAMRFVVEMPSLEECDRRRAEAAASHAMVVAERKTALPDVQIGSPSSDMLGPTSEPTDGDRAVPSAAAVPSMAAAAPVRRPVEKINGRTRRWYDDGAGSTGAALDRLFSR